MKKHITRITLLALVFSAAGFRTAEAQDKPAHASIGALSLPPDSDGTVHLRTGAGASEPLLLSLRNFSAPVKIPTGTIQLFRDPVPAKSDPPPPLLTLTLPAGVKDAFVMVWAGPDAAGKILWKSQVFDASTWPKDSLKVINATGSTLGVSAGSKHLKLTKEGSLDFPVSEWKESFPVKIFKLDPTPKGLFSSVWRVSPGQRELCVLFGQGDGIGVRSLMASALAESRDRER